MAGIGHCPTTNGIVVKCYENHHAFLMAKLAKSFKSTISTGPFSIAMFVYQRVLGLEQSWPERIEMGEQPPGTSPRNRQEALLEWMEPICQNLSLIGDVSPIHLV